MLVKKPHADPAKPLSEQYRLVHNYVELNKNIAPCSYSLRHLYELLDDVASGSVFSVLDLSQGAGHLNHTSTLNTLHQNFTWPNMAKDVETYVCSCLACQRNNPARPGRVAPLQNLTPDAHRFGDRVHLDLVDMPK